MKSKNEKKKLNLKDSENKNYMYVQNGECECDCECVICMCISEYAYVDAVVLMWIVEICWFFGQKFVCFDEMFCLLPKIQHWDDSW